MLRGHQVHKWLHHGWQHAQKQPAHSLRMRQDVAAKRFTRLPRKSMLFSGTTLAEAVHASHTQKHGRALPRWQAGWAGECLLIEKMSLIKAGGCFQRSNPRYKTQEQLYANIKIHCCNRPAVAVAAPSTHAPCCWHHIACSQGQSLGLAGTCKQCAAVPRALVRSWAPAHTSLTVCAYMLLTVHINRYLKGICQPTS